MRAPLHEEVRTGALPCLEWHGSPDPGRMSSRVWRPVPRLNHRLPHDELWALSLSNGQAGSYKETEALS